MTTIPDVRPQTIGAQLERVRLQRRETQLDLIVQCLRDRMRATDACETERSGLRRAIKDFTAELTQIRQRLNETPSSPHAEQPSPRAALDHR